MDALAEFAAELGVPPEKRKSRESSPVGSDIAAFASELGVAYSPDIEPVAPEPTPEPERESFLPRIADAAKGAVSSLMAGPQAVASAINQPVQQTAESLANPAFRETLIEEAPGALGDFAKELGIKVAQAGAGITKGLTLGAVNPAEGTVGIPFTDKKAKVQPGLRETLINLGVSPELAESKVAEVGGEIAGSLAPWTRISKAIGWVAKTGKAAMEGKVIGPAAAKTEQFLSSLFGTTTMGQKVATAGARVAQEGATGAVVGAATVRDPNNPEETMAGNAAQTAAMGVAFAAPIEGVGVAASYLKAKEVRRFYENLAEIFYETKATDPATAQRMAQEVTENIVRRGGIDNISRGTLRKSREALDDVLADIKTKKPVEPPVAKPEPQPVNAIDDFARELGLTVPERPAPAPAPGPTVRPSPVPSDVVAGTPSAPPIELPAITTPTLRGPVPYEVAAAKPSELKNLPEEPQGSTEGPAHALFSYFDPNDSEAGVRQYYNIWGDPADPLVKKYGHGSSVTLETLQQSGIPITGREPRPAVQDYEAAVKKNEAVKAAEAQMSAEMTTPLGGPAKPVEVSLEQQRVNEMFEKLKAGEGTTSTAGTGTAPVSGQAPQATPQVPPALGESGPGSAKPQRNVFPQPIAPSHASIARHPDYIKVTDEATEVVNRYAKQRGIEPTETMGKDLWQELHDALGKVRTAPASERVAIAKQVMAEYPNIEKDFIALKEKLWSDATEGYFERFVAKTPVEPVPEMAGTQAREMPLAEPDVQARASRYDRSGRERQPSQEATDMPETPIRKSDIVSDIEKKLDIPIRVGRMKQKKSVLGIFKTREEVIRMREANDVETATHEAGHSIDKTMGFTKDLAPYAKELEPIATKPHGKGSSLSEGFAEFVRLYVTDPARAKDQAPGFYAFFESRIDTLDPGLKPVLLKSRDEYDRWLKQPAAARILSHINQTPEAAKAPTWERFYTGAFDDLHPIEVATKALSGGKPVDPAKDPYKIARLIRGVMGKVEVFLKHGTFDYKTYELNGKSLEAILKPLENRLDDLRVYLVAKRSLELGRRNILSGIETKDAEHEVARLAAEFEKPAQELYDFQDRVLRYLVEAGVMNEKSYAAIKALNKDYVPFFRALEKEGEGGVAGGAKFVDLLSPVGRIKGSTEELIDPLESIIKNVYSLVQMAEQNAVGQALVDLAEKAEGMGKLVEKIPPKMKVSTVEVKEIKAQLERLGVEVGEDIAEEILTTFQPNTQPEKGGNVISVLRGGKRQYFQVTPELYEAMTGLNKESMSFMMKLLSTPAKMLRLGATITPEFNIRNPIKDQFTAPIYSKYGYNPLDFFRGIAHIVKADDIYVKWLQSGGGRATVSAIDRKETRKTLETLFSDDPRAGRFMYALKHPIDAVLAFMEVGEEATRIGEFAKGLKKQGSGKSAIIESGFAGREVSTDFGRGGSRTKEMKALTAFFGPFMQGLDKMVREAKGNPKKFWIGGTAALTMPTLALWWLNHDEEWYKEKPMWEKNLFWFPSKNVRIPKPFDLSLVFCNIPERFLDYLNDEDPELLKPLMKTIGQSLEFNIIPTFAVPLLENWANKSYFFDSAIVPPDRAGLMPQYQSRPHTSHAANALGKAFGYSPAKIENIIRGYGAGSAKYALDITDELGEWAGIFDEKPVVGKAPLEKIPGLKGLYSRSPSTASTSIEKFYDGVKAARQVRDTVDKLFSTNQIDEGKRVLAKHRPLYEAAGIYEAELKAMAEHKKIIRSLMTDVKSPFMPKDGTPEDRRKLIDHHISEVIKRAKQGNEIAAPFLKRAKADESVGVAKK